jgi:hypothetical protein
MDAQALDKMIQRYERAITETYELGAKNISGGYPHTGASILSGIKTLKATVADLREQRAAL